MLYLRQEGWPIKELAFFFDCDHTSIRKACLRNGLPPELQLFPRPVVVFHNVVWDFNGERLNQGKDYKDYQKIAQKRKSQLPSLEERIQLLNEYHLSNRGGKYSFDLE